MQHPVVVCTATNYETEASYCQTAHYPKDSHLNQEYAISNPNSIRVFTGFAILSKLSNGCSLSKLSNGCSQKLWTLSHDCVSSLHRGHANLLCIIPHFASAPKSTVV